MPIDDQATSRRRFLQFLAASPLLAASDLAAMAAETPSRLPDPMIWAPRNIDKLITSPKEAINIFDFEPVAAKNIPPAHFGYMTGGVNDDVTLRANREGFLKFQLRPRRLVDVSKVDMSTEILGVRYASPIVLAPVGGQRSFHDEGEVASARAEKAGCYAVAVTVDRSGGRNQETLFRLRPTDTRDCNGCHDRSSLQASMKTRPMYSTLDMSGLKNIQSSAMTWDFFKRLRDTTKMKIVIKGILAYEDAVLAADNGSDAIIVSN